MAKSVRGTTHRQHSPIVPQSCVVLGERHLRWTLKRYLRYYLDSRTHLSLGKDSPNPRPIQTLETGRIVQVPQVGGLHHRYERRAARIERRTAKHDAETLMCFPDHGKYRYRRESFSSQDGRGALPSTRNNAVACVAALPRAPARCWRGTAALYRTKSKCAPTLQFYFRISLFCASAIMASASCLSSKPSFTKVFAAFVTAWTYPSCD